MTRTVVVTGAGTGIGRAIALRFAVDSDTRVIGTGRRVAPLEETAALSGNRIEVLACDHADPASLHDLLTRLPDQVDVLVNNAGGNTDFDRAEPDSLDALADQWRANLTANLLTAVLTTAALDDRLAPGGSVISLGSIAADKGSGAYGAAKAALATWNLTVATDLGPRGITANVIAPGFIDQTEFFRDRLSPERRDFLVGSTKTGRVGQPDDVAATAYFLAGSGARHITGQVIHVNGGAQTTR